MPSRVPPSPPNPHIVYMPFPQHTDMQPHWMVASEDQIKTVDYPYNQINEFNVTYYSATPGNENEVANLYDPGNKILASSNVIILGESLSFGPFTYYPLRAKFTLKEKLTSPDVKVTVPNELFGASNQHELNFKFGDYIPEEPEQQV